MHVTQQRLLASSTAVMQSSSTAVMQSPRYFRVQTNEKNNSGDWVVFLFSREKMMHGEVTVINEEHTRFGNCT